MMSSEPIKEQTRNSAAVRCAAGMPDCNACHRWKDLLEGSFGEAETKELESLVEGCDGCHSKLQDSTSRGCDWWDEAKDSWLEGELPDSTSNESTMVSIEVGRDLPDDSLLEMEKVSLSFLSPGTHPELLGRLGRYDVERVIGTGGMGVVLKAYDSELHRVVAIKVLAEHLASSGSARKRFAREAQAAAAIVHNNVIPIYNVETDGKLPYLVMQCISGGSLQAKVDATGPLPVAEALRIAKQTAAGLAAAHEQGLVHRDVKPANILLEKNVDRVMLSDFGLARAVDDASLTRTGVVAGTPHYMSPEQAIGDAIHCSSDQFSFGSVIYFMLTGHPPFRAHNAMAVLNRICHSSHRPVNEVNHEVPVEVCQLVDRLLSKKPQDRFESIQHVESRIDELLSALQTGRLSLAPRLKSTEPNRSWRSFQIGASVIAALGLIAAVVMTLPTSQQSESGEGIVADTSMTVRELQRLKQLDIEDQKAAETIGIELSKLQNELSRFQQATHTSHSLTSPVTFDAEIEQLKRAMEQLDIDDSSSQPRQKPNR
jgi:eukaryotic-like serine/threonine-protein kinase